jgi:hypothetical protein
LLGFGVEEGVLAFELAEAQGFVLGEEEGGDQAD